MKVEVSPESIIFSHSYFIRCSFQESKKSNKMGGIPKLEDVFLKMLNVRKITSTAIVYRKYLIHINIDELTNCVILS